MSGVETKNRVWNRLLAVVLSLAIVLTSMPASSKTAHAATEEHPNAVTITVCDENGNPVEGAEVSGTLSGTVSQTFNKTTDVYGCAEVLPAEEYAEGITVDATIKKDLYQETIIWGQYISSADKDFSVTLKPLPEITNIQVNAIPALVYNGELQPAFSLDDVRGIQAEDVVTYRLNEEEEVLTTIPQIRDRGIYKVTMYVERQGYLPYEYVVPVEMKAASIDGVTISVYRKEYDGAEHEAVKVLAGVQEGDVVEYKFAWEEDTAWSTEVPMIKDWRDGDYPLQVRISRGDNYEPKVIDETAAIYKRPQTLRFENEEYTNNGSSYIEIIGIPPFDQTYNFKAVDDNQYTDNAIEYTVSFTEAEDEGIATFDEENLGTGQLKVTDVGTVKVTATLPGDQNHEACEINYILEIGMNLSGVSGQLIAFPQSAITYVLGDNEGQLYQTAQKTFSKDRGQVTYALQGSYDWISCDRNTGELSINNYARLGEILAADESVTVTVKADKERAGRKYPADYAEYTLTIRLDDIPENTYAISPDSVKGENNWYTSEVTILPADSEAYLISDSCEPASFKTSVVYENSGTEYYVYLQNIATGRITKQIKVTDLQIDREAPSVNNMKIEFLDTNLIERILSAITFGFYKPSVTIRFTAKDTVSGIDHFNWTYTKESGASDINEGDCGDVISVSNEADGTAVAELKLPAEEAEEIKQYRGTIAFTATDKAGLTSECKSDNSVFVVDSIKPASEFAFVTETVQTIGARHYFNGDVQAKLSITEANFYADDVVIKVSKDGGRPEALSISPENWVADEQIPDTYNTIITLSGDGEYVIYADYVDKCENEMEPYESDVIIIDTTAPEIVFAYEQQDDMQSATFKVTEHNFRAADILVGVEAVDINGNPLDVEDIQTALREGEWTTKGDVHTIVLTEFLDAIYTLKIDYADLALNPAETCTTDPFVIDHTAPRLEDMTITYSEPLQETILTDEELKETTLGFYNPLPTEVEEVTIAECLVTVTFAAVDPVSGIDRFDWTYLREAGASIVNVESAEGELKWNPEELDPEKIEIVQNTEDKSIFTATLVLPREEAEQLRGNIGFTATDRCGNESEKLEDSDYVVVVDSIAPTIEAECSEANRTVETEGETKLYFNQAAAFSFKITEANFFAEDVIVAVAKNGGEPKTAEVTWTKSGTEGDEYIGTLTIDAPHNHSGDGDYVVSVSYMDKSNNIMEAFTSDTIVIDTTPPVIEVTYSNQNVIRTLKDSDGKDRKYFDDVQVATVLIKEHNFEAEEVESSIIAKDVTGKALDVNALTNKSGWKDSADSHTMTITYSGDSNYTFDIDYTDLATNEAEDYSPDYFTVDRTDPVNLTITYSTSVLDTVLESATFGFYNTRVKVTITAEDPTSGIYEFIYSYRNAEGVSAVNAELLEQVISSDLITYSDSGQKATASFEIPREALGANNQFNGTVEFAAGDRSGNSNELKDNKRIVVDNLAPSLRVDYNAPVNEEAGVSYYDGNINATLTLTEANFYPQDIVVTVTKNGTAYEVVPSWRDTTTDIHVGTFTLTEDGDYQITVDYKDKSENNMAAYVSNQLTIDTQMEAPVITINDKEETGKAYKNEVIPAVSFADQNFDDYQITLTQTRYGAKNVDVTEMFVGEHMAINAKGGSGIFDEFAKLEENDGIYKLTVTITDKAGHESTSVVDFTVNRFGSVYVYSDYLASLIAKGGIYTPAITENLSITEYNADRLLENSLSIEITKDGKPLDSVKYDVSPVINELVSVGESGWFQYDYTISKDNFTADGVYKIFISSKDATGNVPENTNFEDKNILFRVDSTTPEITSITGLEKSIINAQEVTAHYIVYDTMGLKSIKVLIDGKQVGETITDFSADLNNYEGNFTVKESSEVQQVRLVVEDLAGNITDTDAEKFESAYVFYHDVTVSTNFFVRWYADKPLFWGSIGGGAVVLSALIWLIILLKRKKEK